MIPLLHIEVDKVYLGGNVLSRKLAELCGISHKEEGQPGGDRGELELGGLVYELYILALDGQGLFSYALRRAGDSDGVYIGEVFVVCGEEILCGECEH